MTAAEFVATLDAENQAALRGLAPDAIVNAVVGVAAYEVVERRRRLRLDVTRRA